jgi:hypothetical protein
LYLAERGGGGREASRGHESLDGDGASDGNSGSGLRGGVHVCV